MLKSRARENNAKKKSYHKLGTVTLREKKLKEI